MSETLNQIILVAAVVVWILLMVRTYRQWRVVKKWVEPKDLNNRLGDGEDVLVLDVRTPEEFTKEGHIAGAVNVPLRDLSGKLAEIKADLAAFRDLPVVVVCKIGGRSTSALPRLERAGLKQVRIMRGGMRRWGEQGLPVQKE